jgi:elongation factor P hydroxylase
MMTVDHEPRNYAVFEIVNADLKEIYVGSTNRAIFEIARGFHRAPPESIKHWNFAGVETVRSIEFGLGAEDARAFVTNYIGTELPDGWRFIHEPNAPAN